MSVSIYETISIYSFVKPHIKPILHMSRIRHKSMQLNIMDIMRRQQEVGRVKLHALKSWHDIC